jgi:hypothetical protein
MFISVLNRRAGAADRQKGTAAPTGPPECTRRAELELASRRDIRSEIIPRPVALEMTEPSVEEPFGACEAAVYPAVGEALSVALQRDHNVVSSLAVAVLVPLLNGVIELLEAGYGPEPLRLSALAHDECGGLVVVDTGLLLARRERPSAAATSPGGGEQAIPAEEALSTLAAVVAEFSGLLGESRMVGPALSTRWASWCDQIEGASARATLTLLEAQLFAWCAEQAWVRSPANPAGPPNRADLASPEDPAHDEAAPTEVDAARGD